MNHRPQHVSQHPLPRPSLIQVILSVLASFFGVQNRQNFERDFKHGKAAHYIVVGLVMTIVLIVVLASLVNLVLRVSGV
ncbi:MAG: DUF2970 domain-containing protein [Candidatus Contendobacter sp.]|nr:DUF2970 domain-containing protein [Candidatus Contendobacter sp.]MDG4558904.1 DUF2970 domain-containing protein [Candidatus Contendobacter sp.]